MQVGITWRIGKMGVPMTASQLNWGLRHVWVWCQAGVGVSGRSGPQAGIWALHEGSGR